MRRLSWAIVLFTFAASAEDAFEAAIHAWQEERAARLTAEDGWTTVVGLHWLEPGEHRFPSIPAPVEFRYENGVVQALYEGQWRELRDDDPGPPDLLTLGDITVFAIERDGRHAIRVRDKNSTYRRNFKGLEYFPVHEAYRVNAKWIPYDEPKPVSVATVIDGLSGAYEATGKVELQLDGQTVTLEPVVEGDSLFYIFKDATSGKTTYGAGRYLYTDLPKDGQVEIDFNRAYSPPCAFTPYATCPLPPPENRLPIAIEAGEKDYHYE